MVDVASALAIVVAWGAGATALTAAAGYFLHPAAGVVVALFVIWGTGVAIEVNR